MSHHHWTAIIIAAVWGVAFLYFLIIKCFPPTPTRPVMKRIPREALPVEVRRDPRVVKELLAEDGAKTIKNVYWTKRGHAAAARNVDIYDVDDYRNHIYRDERGRLHLLLPAHLIIKNRETVFRHYWDRLIRIQERVWLDIAEEIE